MKSMIAGTEGVILNPRNSIGLNLWEWVGEFPTLPLTMIKYRNLDKVYDELPDAVKLVVLHMKGFVPNDPDMNLLLDYKVRDLKEGDTGCPLSFWHLDVVENPHHQSKPDRHWIFSTEIGTEFMTSEIRVDSNVRSFKEVEVEDYSSIITKPKTINSYGRFNLHRATPVERDCRRVLIRLTQTEVIK